MINLDDLMTAPFEDLYSPSVVSTALNSDSFCCNVRQIFGEDETVFIPVVIFNVLNKHFHFGESQADDYDLNNYSDIVLSLSKGSGSFKRRTARSFLRELANTSHSSNVLQKVYCKDTLYYITRGLVLDADLNPIIIWGFEAKKITNDANTYSLYTICRRKILVSPRLFTKNDTFCKYMLKTGIPTVFVFQLWNTRTISTAFRHPALRNSIIRTAQNEIDVEFTNDIDTIIGKPAKRFSDNDSIKELLKKHRDEVENYGWS